MTTLRLLRRRRFLPLFCTQLLNAFNDNLYKTAMVLFVVYAVYSDPETETVFSAIATGLFIGPFILVSAIAGQLADMRDKAKIIRTVKLCEIGIMTIGAAGLFLAWQDTLVHSVAVPLMLFALFLAGLQSTFLGPIKYAILPQHLRKTEVLAGTGLVEAGTYVAILFGTIIAGWIPVEAAMVAIIMTALVGYAMSRQIPAAPALGEIEPIDWNILRSSIALIRSVRKDRVVWLATLSISVFWMVGAILFIQFPPLVKNVIHANKEVATLFIVMFSIGIAIGSVVINHLLKGEVSARHAPAGVVAMGFFLVLFYVFVRQWPTGLEGPFLTVPRVSDIPAGVGFADQPADDFGRRGHLRGAALCLPDHPGGGEHGLAHHRGNQCDQFQLHGVRIGAGLGHDLPRHIDRRTAARQRGAMPDYLLDGPQAPRRGASAERPPRLENEHQRAGKAHDIGAEKAGPVASPE
jgi:hypothetical protein